MYSRIVSVIIILIISTAASTITQKAKSYTGLVSNQQTGISYTRVGSSYFGQVPPNSVQCTFACTSEDNCKSVYMDGEACVFGVDDVTAFEEGEEVTPDSSQVLRVKG